MLFLPILFQAEAQNLGDKRSISFKPGAIWPDNNGVHINAHSGGILYQDAFIFIADKWEPKNAIEGRYLWLPITFKGDDIEIKWLDHWNLVFFTDKNSK